MSHMHTDVQEKAEPRPKDDAPYMIPVSVYKVRILPIVFVVSLAAINIKQQEHRESADMSHSHVVRSVPLNSGASIPSVGLGVFLSRPGSECYNAVMSALRLGYR